MAKALASVTIVDYGMGNIQSIVAAITHLGYEAQLYSDPDEILRSEIIILPGVGSFPSAMGAVKDRGIDLALREAFLRGGSKILGICLGMQLLAESSTEDGGSQGLGIFPGAVERFGPTIAASLPIPHVGFNSVTSPADSVLFRGLGPQTDFYFVHSFRISRHSSTGLLATSIYGEGFVAAFEMGNLFGTQFHPEKSQSNGLRLLSNFLQSEIT